MVSMYKGTYGLDLFVTLSVTMKTWMIPVNVRGRGVVSLYSIRK